MPTCQAGLAALALEYCTIVTDMTEVENFTCAYHLHESASSLVRNAEACSRHSSRTAKIGSQVRNVKGVHS